MTAELNEGGTQSDYVSCGCDREPQVQYKLTMDAEGKKQQCSWVSFVLVFLAATDDEWKPLSNGSAATLTICFKN